MTLSLKIIVKTIGKVKILAEVCIQQCWIIVIIVEVDYERPGNRNYIKGDTA